MSTSLRRAVLASLLPLVVACTETTEPEPPVTVGLVQVTASASVLQVGQTLQLAATVRSTTDSLLTDRPVTWSSNGPNFATVSSTGLVTAIAQGTVVISATSGGVAGDFTLSVIPIPVGIVEVTPSAASIFVGATQPLTVVTRSAGGAVLTGRTVAWQSTSPGVATVSTTGLVTGTGPGVALVFATSEGVSDTTTITVQQVPVATLTLTPSADTIAIAETVTLTATTRDASNNILLGRPITWGTLNAAVATVSGSGVVTGVALGVTGIVATSEGKADTTTITVTMPAGSWAMGQTMVSARWHFAFAAVNGVAVAAGGFRPTPGHVRSVETLALPSGSWNTRSDRPSVQTSGAAGAIGSQLYVAGGTDAAVLISQTWSYAPGTNTWVARASMPGGVRADAAGAVVNGVLYAAGGRDGAGVLTRLEAFDPSTDSAGTWTPRAAMPTSRREAGAAGLDGLVYVAGGVVVGDTVSGVLEVYDPVSNTWSTRAPMPTPRRDLVLVASNGVLYAIGGNNGNHLATVEAYVPSRNAWYTLAPMPTARTGARGAAFNGKIYVLGGYSGINFALTTMEVFTP